MKRRSKPEESMNREQYLLTGDEEYVDAYDAYEF